MCVTSVIMYHKCGGGGGVCVSETGECILCV